MCDLTDDQVRRLYRFVQRLRDKLAVDICHNGLKDPREFAEVCELLNEVRPAVYPDHMPDGVDRRGRPH